VRESRSIEMGVAMPDMGRERSIVSVAIRCGRAVIAVRTRRQMSVKRCIGESFMAGRW